MCVVSMVMDHYTEKWATLDVPTYTYSAPSRVEFDELKKEVLEMKELLRKAKIYDVENNQADCEKEDKVALVKKIAEMVGVDLTDLLDK